MYTIGTNISGYDWDEGNIQKCQKHGVSIEEIEGLFDNPSCFVQSDMKHSQEESRYLAIGLPPESNRPMFVAFTIRTKGDKEYIRPISARYMHEKEARQYEQKITSIQNR
jgi:uncharacterized DUF497 family protein